MKKKILITVTAVALVLCFVVGGTLAWLIDKTDPVVNTFTYGDINITLTETEGTLVKDEKGNVTGSSFKMIPGTTIDKDPTVTVEANSEACWLFVKVEKSANYDKYLESKIADGWTALTGVDDAYDVYYRDVLHSESDQSFAVLKEDKVTVKGTVTKEMLTASDFTNPTLTFTAYAIQQASFPTPEGAWTEINK